MSLSVIDDLSTLRLHRQQIGELFEATFGRPFDIDEWEWLFGENPNGMALVALWHEGGRLAGHTAFVPFTFSDGTARLRAYRSGTTMIDPACETPGLMALLGRELQGRARAEGAPVFGFPNDQSWLGFKRFLRWTIVEGHLADVPGRTILGDPLGFTAKPNPGEFTFDMTHQQQVEWRLRRPSVRYRVRDGTITSTYQGTEQLLRLSEAGLPFIDPNGIYRVLDLSPQPAEPADGATYRFGYWSPPGASIAKFARPELLWSDVF